MNKFVKYITEAIFGVERPIPDLRKECPTIAIKRALAKERLGAKWLLATKVERKHPFFQLKG